MHPHRYKKIKKKIWRLDLRIPLLEKGDFSIHDNMIGKGGQAKKNNRSLEWY